MRHTLTAAITVLISAPVVFGQPTYPAPDSPAQPSSLGVSGEPVRVAVEHAGDDALGRRLAFLVREAVRGSAGYELSGERDAQFMIRLTTVDPIVSFDDLRGATTAAGVVVTRSLRLTDDGNPLRLYLTSQVVVLGEKMLAGEAANILAELDSWAEASR